MNLSRFCFWQRKKSHLQASGASSQFDTSTANPFVVVVFSEITHRLAGNIAYLGRARMTVVGMGQRTAGIPRWQRRIGHPPRLRRAWRQSHSGPPGSRYRKPVPAHSSGPAGVDTNLGINIYVILSVADDLTSFRTKGRKSVAPMRLLLENRLGPSELAKQKHCDRSIENRLLFGASRHTR